MEQEKPALHVDFFLQEPEVSFLQSPYNRAPRSWPEGTALKLTQTSLSLWIVVSTDAFQVTLLLFPISDWSVWLVACETAVPSSKEVIPWMVSDSWLSLRNCRETWETQLRSEKMWTLTTLLRFQVFQKEKSSFIPFDFRKHKGMVGSLVFHDHASQKMIHPCCLNLILSHSHLSPQKSSF